MEIRKTNSGREIKKTDMQVRRKAARAIVTGYYGKRAVAGLGGQTVPVAKKAAEGGIGLAKNAIRSKDVRVQLKYLTKEQRRQWNAYSYRKQTRILEKAENTTLEKMEANKGSVGVTPLHTKAMALQEELQERAYGYRTNGMTMSDKWEVSAPKGKTADEMKKNLKVGSLETETFYTDNINRGAKKVKSIENRYTKAVKSEKAEGRALFISAFLNTLDREGRKADQIKEMWAEDQISQMQAENQASSAMLGYVAAPIKVKVQMMVQKFIRKIAEKAGAMLLKFLATVLLPVLCIFLLLTTVINIVAGGSPEVESGAIEIGGGGYSATGSQIADYALQWIGTPYVWGYADLETAVDCSGFTYCVYAHFGINLPRTSFEQGNTEQGQYITSLDDAVPGDLIWWTPRHVGIYIGNGQAVQSSGDQTNYDLAHAGRGVCVVQADYRTIGTIRRFVEDVTEYGGEGTGGNGTDPTEYTQEQLELIWAIVAQEDSGSYEGSLAVISSAMNRAESPAWIHHGASAFGQLTAPGQYCYSADIGGNWQDRLGGNVPTYTKQAVNDCLANGVRNHGFTSFRSTAGEGGDRVQIGGNWYFN